MNIDDIKVYAVSFLWKDDPKREVGTCWVAEVTEEQDAWLMERIEAGDEDVSNFDSTIFFYSQNPIAHLYNFDNGEDFMLVEDN